MRAVNILMKPSIHDKNVNTPLAIEEFITRYKKQYKNITEHKARYQHNENILHALLL